MGAESPWMPDHFMSFISQLVWKPRITSAAKLVLSPDGFFDPMQILAVTASRIRGVDLGTAVTEAYRRHPMALAQSFATPGHISNIGGSLTGGGVGDFWRLGSLIRKLRRL